MAKLIETKEKYDVLEFSFQDWETGLTPSTLNRGNPRILKISSPDLVKMRIPLSRGTSKKQGFLCRFDKPSLSEVRAWQREKVKELSAEYGKVILSIHHSWIEDNSVWSPANEIARKINQDIECARRVLFNLDELNNVIEVSSLSQPFEHYWQRKQLFRRYWDELKQGQVDWMDISYDFEDRSHPIVVFRGLENFISLAASAKDLSQIHEELTVMQQCLILYYTDETLEIHHFERYNTPEKPHRGKHFWRTYFKLRKNRDERITKKNSKENLEVIRPHILDNLQALQKIDMDLKQIE